MIEPVVCIIPAYNAEASVHNVARGIKRVLPRALVLGVDDGSTDGTRSLLKAACDHTIAFEKNMGKGAALRAGIDWALGNGAAAVLTIDADGQHDPAFAPSLIQALDNADIVIGTREISGRVVPIHRRLANMLSTAVTRIISKCAIRDSQSGYRAIRAEVLRKISPEGDRYEYETDFIILAGQAGYRFAAVPVPTIYESPTPSNFRPLQSSWAITKTLWRHRAGLLR